MSVCLNHPFLLSPIEHRRMTGKIQCDGCRQLFTYAEMKLHLSIDSYLEKMKGSAPAMNPRGNRATTAPLVNFNDPQLTIQLCPRRAERLGRAGAMQCDERAPESLPIVLPAPMGKLQLEQLKDTLLQAWEARKRQTATDATVAGLQKQGGDSSTLRPREGRNILVDDAVRRMNAAKDRDMKAAAAKPVAPPLPPAPLVAKVVPDYMKPLRRDARPISAQQVPVANGKQRNSYHDPQEGGNARPHKGLTVLTAGQVTPVYIRM